MYTLPFTLRKRESSHEEAGERSDLAVIFSQL